MIVKTTGMIPLRNEDGSTRFTIVNLLFVGFGLGTLHDGRDLLFRRVAAGYGVCGMIESSRRQESGHRGRGPGIDRDSGLFAGLGIL